MHPHTLAHPPPLAASYAHAHIALAPAQVGLTLTAAEAVIFAELVWTPADLTQVITTVIMRCITIRLIGSRSHDVPYLVIFPR